MTLIELLIVIVIMTILVAAAIPLLSPANDDRRIRESARGLNTFITGAQARAISLGRPVGVALKRLGSDTNTDPQKHVNAAKNFHADNGACLEVFYVEELPPYAGFDANSRASVAIIPNGVLVRFVTRGNDVAQNQDGLPAGWDTDLFPAATIHPGDVIEISGSQFRLLPVFNAATNIAFDNTTGCFKTADGRRPATILAQPVNDGGQQINPRYDSAGFEIGAIASATAPYWTSPATYKVLRQPTAMSDEPYQLPEGTAIDLRASGIGQNTYFYWPQINDNDQGVLIMFTPEGRIARVAFYHAFPPLSQNTNDQPYDQSVVENVYLLVGRRDRIAPPDVASDPTLQSSAIASATTDEQKAKLREPINWLNGDSRWIVIGAQTGRIATIENAAVDLAAYIQKYTSSPGTLSQSSEDLRAAQILEAREFTREMGQLGGR